MPPKTVIEVARRAAHLSQRRLAEVARTQQSSISEYERRRKSPTLDVVERLLNAADHELTVKPMVFWNDVEGPDDTRYAVPDRLWSVPIPDCFARVQVWKLVLPTEISGDWAEDVRTWDLSKQDERIDFYELMLQYGAAQMVEGAVDGLLLIHAWPQMNLPDGLREAWQPLLDAVTDPKEHPLRDPGGLNARIANDLGISWPLKKGWRQRWARDRSQVQARARH